MIASTRAGHILRMKGRVPGEYIVKLKAGVVAPQAAGVRAVVDGLASKHRGTRKHVFHSALQGFSVRMSESDALALSQDPRVEIVEENAVAEPHAVQSDAPWGLDRIDQVSPALDGMYDNRGLDGQGVTVYVIDSGIRTSHVEFEGRATVGADFIGDGRNGQDGFGHGTHVAGTIAGKTFGVAKQAHVVSVRVLDDKNRGLRDGFIAGVDWVTANHAAGAIANMSLGSGASEIFDGAMRNSINAGVTYVLSAGNDETDALGSPARVAEAIVVGAIGPDDALASFSNYGAGVDLFAPGVDVESAYNFSDTSTYLMSGTSMAAPHVTGLAALYRQAMPTATPTMIHDAIIGAATEGTMPDPGPSSPNRVAYIGNDAVAQLSDDFESGSSAWTVVDGTWSVVTDGSQVYQGASTTGFARATALTAMPDQVIEARVKPVSFAGSDRSVMLLGRYTDTSNHYLLTMRSTGVVEIKRVQAGVRTTLASTTYTVVTGTWYTVKLEIVGTALRGYVNGTLLVAATDSGLGSGKVGIGAWYAQARFDDVRVTLPGTGTNAATHPYPPAGASGVDPRAVLAWTSGADAFSHDVYFGTTNPPPFVVTSDAAHYSSDPLANSTTYYWRIDEHTSTGTIVPGTVWSFTTGVAPGKVTLLYPWHGASNLQTLEFRWLPGDNSTLQTVYLGTENPPPYVGTQPIERTYLPSNAFSLKPETTYYWRIDESNANYTTPGDVWTFTTGTWGEWSGDLSWPANPSPANGATNVSPQTSFSWTPATGVTAEILSISAVLDLDHKLEIKSTLPPGTGSYAPPMALLANTNYGWSVEVQDSDGTPWGRDFWQFITGTPSGAPGWADITSPGDGQYGVSQTATITWTAATAASSYELYVCNGDNFTYCSTDFTVYTTTGTSFTLPTLTGGKYYYVTIVSRNSVCGTRGSRIRFQTIADSSVPPPSGAASNPSPADGATLDHATLMLSWTLPAGADSGALYIGPSPTDLEFVSEEEDTHVTRDFVPNQPYYWRVDSINAGGRVQGPVWSFTTGPRVAPGAPSNPTPADGTSGVDPWSSSVELSWTEGAGTTSADVYFGTSWPLPLVEEDLTSSNHLSVQINSCATYYWRVVEKNRGGSTPGPEWHFTTQYLLPDPFDIGSFAPSNGSTDQSPTPKLSWAGPRGANDYSVWMAPALFPLELVSSHQSDTWYMPPPLATNMTYFWQVVAHNPAGDTAGPLLMFTTGGANSPASNPSPPEGATDVSTLTTLTWTVGQGAADQKAYISLGDTANWKEIGISVSGTDGSADPGPLLDNSTYYWRVDTVTPTGEVLVGVNWFFSTGTSSALPGLPSNPSPPDGATGRSIRPSFTFTPGAGTTKHHLYLWEVGVPHETPMFEFVQPDALFIPGYLKPNTLYGWFVGEENDYGIRRGPFWFFTTGTEEINLPGPPTNPAPADGATGVSTSPTLTWTAGADAESHDVYFGASNPPAFIQNQSSTSFTPVAPLLPGTTYYWRVDERNAAGVTTGPVWSFTTAAAPPGPCTDLCSSPTTITINGSYQSGAIGTGATCFQTTSPVHGGNCGNFVWPRTLRLNGVQKVCNNQNWWTIPPARNGGYCVQTTAGDYPWAFFTLW